MNHLVLYNAEVKKDGIYTYFPTYTCISRLCCTLLCSINKPVCTPLNCFDFSSPFTLVHFTLRCVMVQQCATFFNCKFFGGLEVACWPLVPKFTGSNPAEAVGFLRVNKNPQHVGRHGCLSVVIVVCCQVEVSATN